VGVWYDRGCEPRGFLVEGIVKIVYHVDLG
jgi:hypothetical protein